jgi:hypothetical protein
MKKKFYLTLIPLAAIVVLVAYRYQLPGKTDLESFARNKENLVVQANNPDLIKSSGIKSKNNPVPRKPSSKNYLKDDIANPLDRFSKQEIELFNGRYLLVEGAFASIDKVTDHNELTNLGGFFVYDFRNEKSLQVVFDSVKKQYGVFTGEIIVKGGYTKAMSIIEELGLEINFKNDLIGQVIFKVENIQDLSLLSELKSIPNVSVTPDLKFSRLKSM